MRKLSTLLLGATTLAFVPASVRADGWQLTFDFEANSANSLNGIVRAGQGGMWKTSVPYLDMSTGNKGVVNARAPSEGGSQYSIVDNALNMAINSTYSPYLETGFSQQYGFWTASIQQAPNGCWSAWWLLPTSGPWPPEFDIVEGDGRSAQFTNHGGDIHQPVNNYNVFNRPDLATGFHEYSMLWTASSVTWYLDNVAQYTAPTASNEHQPMKGIMSAYAQDGACNGAMKVAHVRVYSGSGAPPFGVSPAVLAATPPAQQKNIEALGNAAAQAGEPSSAITPSMLSPSAWKSADTATQAVQKPAGCGDSTGSSQFIVLLNGKKIGGVRSVQGLNPSDLPGPYNSGSNGITFQMVGGSDGGTVLGCTNAPVTTNAATEAATSAAAAASKDPAVQEAQAKALAADPASVRQQKWEDDR